MSSFLMPEAAALVRTIQAVVLFILFTVFAPLALQGAEPCIVSLKGFETAEVRSQGFVLPRAAKVHIYAKGGGIRRVLHEPSDTPLFAYGWILNAATREVVWGMGGANTRRDWEFRIADQYLELPAGSYEAYFANHGFGQGMLLGQWSRNLDRRTLPPAGTERPRGFLAAFGADEGSMLRRWREQVGHYGMEIYLPGGDPSAVARFEAPLRWKNIVVSLPGTVDGSRRTQAFRLARPVTLHVYAEGEGGEERLSDFGWITDARTRVRVWEMEAGKAQYAGGSRKNRRQVETVQLPAGEYEAGFGTDDSHSAADWNAAPPCDPGMYGLTLAIPSDAEAAAFSLSSPRAWPVLAELVRVGNDEDRSAELVLPGARSVRIQAIAERGGDEMADEAWIEDASGQRVWHMDPERTRAAGGARKNREIDEVVSLPKGRYTLRVRTDDSHAYGHWNTDAPWEAERYGLTVFAEK